jgi:hypothetical protein
MIKLKNIISELGIQMTSSDPKHMGQQTRDEYVLIVSRDIVNAFKSGQARYRDTFDMYLDGEEAEVELDVKFMKRPNQEYAFSIAAGYGPRTFSKREGEALELVIEYNPQKFPNAMQALVSEIKETLEHEFEHVGQDNFDSMFVVSNRYDQPLAYPEESPQAPTHFLYLTSNKEVPAYVKGLIKRARTNKISFEQALEDYYNDYRDTFALYNTDWNQVKQIWMNWHNANQVKLKKA